MALTVGRQTIRVLVESIEEHVALVIDPQGAQRTVPLYPRQGNGPAPKRGETWLIDNALGGWTFYAILSPNLRAPEYVDPDSLLTRPLDDDTWVDDEGRPWGHWSANDTYGLTPRGLILDSSSAASLRTPIVVHPGLRYHVRMPLASLGPNPLDIHATATFVNRQGIPVAEHTFLMPVSDPFDQTVIAFPAITAPADGYGLHLSVLGEDIHGGGHGQVVMGPVVVQRVSTSQNQDAVIISVVEEYATSINPVVPPVDGWSYETPEWGGGRYIWRRMASLHADGTTTYSEPAVLTGNVGEDAVLVRIASSRGTTFKNNAISTELTITIFKGATQIVNQSGLQAHFGSGAYLEWWWRRIDDSEFGVISASDSRLSDFGFTFTISPADVDEQTVFQCILHA